MDRRTTYRLELAPEEEALAEALLLPALKAVPRATLPDRNSAEIAALFTWIPNGFDEARCASLERLYAGEVRDGEFLVWEPVGSHVRDRLARYAVHTLADRHQVGKISSSGIFHPFMLALRIKSLHPELRRLVRAANLFFDLYPEDCEFLTSRDRRARLSALRQLADSVPSGQWPAILEEVAALLISDDLMTGPAAWDSVTERAVDLDAWSWKTLRPELTACVQGDEDAQGRLRWALLPGVSLSAIRQLPAFRLAPDHPDWGQPRMQHPHLLTRIPDDASAHVKALYTAWIWNAPALGVFPPLSVIDRMDHLQALDAASAGLSEADRPPLLAPIRDCIRRDVLGETEARWDALVAEALIDGPLSGPVPDLVELLRPEHRLGPESLQRAMARALTAARVARALDREEEQLAAEHAARRAPEDAGG